MQVTGESLDDGALRSAIVEAGYDAAVTAPMGTLAGRPGRVELAIEGMTCASCAARIEKRLNRLDGVEASVNFASEHAAVCFDPGQVSIEDVIASVQRAGYHASLPREALGEDDPARSLRPRLLVAVVLAVPLVLLAMVPGVRFSGWEWVSFALATPAVFWCGWPFHRAAVLNARHLVVTMDTLISIGTIAAWTWSTVVSARGAQPAHVLRIGRDDHGVDPARPLLRGAGQTAIR